MAFGGTVAGVKLRRITKSFGPVEVIKGVSLDVADGVFLTLVGPSGCGNTALLRIIAGLEREDDGEVLIGDQAVMAHESLFHRLRSGIVGWSLSAPAIILMILLLLAPVAAVVWLLGADYLFGAKTFNYIGLENYENLLEDRIFWKALRNTFVYTAVVVLFSFGLGLLVAIPRHLYEAAAIDGADNAWERFWLVT